VCNAIPTTGAEGVIVPQALRDLTQWLIWRFEAHEEQGKKPRKMPYYADGGKRVGKQGSKEDRDRLVTYTEAKKAAPADGKGGVGFAFLPSDGLAGIDLDAMIDKDSGEMNPRHVAIIKALDSFTELSPSRRGVHIFVSTSAVGAFQSFKRNAIGVEVFCGAQFFTFTGDLYAGSTHEIRPLSAKNLQRLRATVRAKKPSTPTASASTPPSDDDQRRADAALVYVNADEYKAWIDIGMALKHAFADAGYSIWDRWSARSAKYPGGEETRRRWATFEPSGAVKLGTVFELAKQGGYLPPRAPQKRQRAERPASPPAGNSGEPPAQSNSRAGEPGDEEAPVIKWVQGELPKCVDQAEDALIKSKMRIYQRAGYLVRVVRRDTPTVRLHFKRPPGALGLLTVDAPYLIETMTRSARWKKWNAKVKDKETGDMGAWVPMNAPEQAAQTYIARRGHWQVPILWAAISAPTLRPDGTVLQEEGYDSKTQSWYDSCGVVFPWIPENPTIHDARAALEKLKAAFATFPFETEADKAVAYALALTAIVRRSLPSAPLGAITAPVMASGKTLLADCIAILATGVSAPSMKYADTDEEATKTMLAVLAEGDQVVLIDNVERPLEGDTLCVVLTSESFRQRVLGRTEMMSVPTTTLFLATGNHLVIAGDLRTRALLCRLDPEVERPEERQFPIELRTWITEKRPELVAAALTIMRAFIATKQDPREICKQWGRFEAWSDMVRAPLIWLDCADPCASLKELEKEDPDRIELGRVIASWKDAFAEKMKTGAKGHTASEAIAIAVSARDAPLGVDQEGTALDLVLREICRDRDGSLSAKRLSNWLRKHANRLVDGQCIVRAGNNNDHTLLYKVEERKTS
jgi:putative DNA primase/helicase